MRCACTCASSSGGVSQRTSILIWYFSPSSFAAASAPVRALRNTGLVELFAIIAMRKVLSPCAAGATARSDCALEVSVVFSFRPHATASRAIRPAVRRCIGVLSEFCIHAGNAPLASRDTGASAQPPRGNVRAPPIDNDRNDNRASDHDPLVILIE